MNEAPSLAVALGAALVVALLPAAARAQLGGDVGGGEDATNASPATAVPTSQPPPPPDNLPAPPTDDGASADAPAAASGQWVFTSQDGWVWMPYGDDYVYTPPDDSGQPYQYLYVVTAGWTWLVAPSIWGIGPAPYFGAAGPWHYHWYQAPMAHAAGTHPRFRGGYKSHPHAGHLAPAGHKDGRAPGRTTH